jgi:hypothetical protein
MDRSRILGTLSNLDPSKLDYRDMRGYLLKKEIEKYLAEGRLSQRQIARLLRVSRSVVKAIADGRRRRRERILQKVVDESALKSRCPSCGYHVPQPCVYCRALEYRRRTTVGKALPDTCASKETFQSRRQTSSNVRHLENSPPIDDSPAIL